MQILLATSNPHKLGEIQAVLRELGDTGIALVSLETLGLALDEPVEDQPTFEGNAQLKACYYAKGAAMHCLADDSGLEVDALGGEPGVLSARYAGATGGRDAVDAANNGKLLGAIREVPAEKRAARFVCAMSLADPQGCVLATVRGTIEGRIIDEPRGDNGFGYDPLFFVPDLGKTTAELSPQHKNAISHRGAATRLMWEKLRGMR